MLIWGPAMSGYRVNRYRMEKSKIKRHIHYIDDKRLRIMNTVFCVSISSSKSKTSISLCAHADSITVPRSRVILPCYLFASSCRQISPNCASLILSTHFRLCQPTSYFFSILYGLFLLTISYTILPIPVKCPAHLKLCDFKILITLGAVGSLKSICKLLSLPVQRKDFPNSEKIEPYENKNIYF